MSVLSDVNNKPLTDKIAERFKPTAANGQHLTVASIKKHLPKGSSIAVTQEIVDILNRVEEDSGVDQDLFEEQLLGYMHLAKNGGVLKLMNAIKFVALIQLPSMTIVNAYRIVFPDKAKSADEKGQDLSSFASMYNTTTMVKEIVKMQVLGFYVTHAHLKNWAMAKTVNMANGIGARPSDRVSPTVQLKALEMILEKVTPPEDNSIELKIGMSDEAKSATQNLTNQLEAMAQIQLANLKAGKSLDDVQKLGISFTDVEVVEGD